MKTRYSALTNVKKNMMQKSERSLQHANANLCNAKEALKNSFKELHTIKTPKTGNIQKFLSARTLLDAGRSLISHNEEWIRFAQKEIEEAKEQLKRDSIEFEKYNYLELEELKQVLQVLELKEAKELDNVALMTYGIKRKKEKS